MTAPIVKSGEAAISLDSFAHKTAAGRSAGLNILSADTTLVNNVGLPSPYTAATEYALKLNFNKAAYVAYAIMRAGAGTTPSLGTTPIFRAVFLMKHTTAHPTTAILLANWHVGFGQHDANGYRGIKLNTSGQIELWLPPTAAEGTLANVGTGSTVMALDTWYFVEYLIHKESTTYRHVIRLYNSAGTYIATEVNVAGQAAADLAYIGLQFGEVNSGAAASRGCEVYIGPVYTACEDGAADLLKPTIRRLTPNGAGTYNDWGGRAYDAAAVNIVSSTNASPINVVATAHGLVTGDHCEIANHGTNTNANGTFIVTWVNANNVTLNGSTGNGVGGASGTIRKCNPVLANYDDLLDVAPDGTTYSITPENDTTLGIHVAVGTIADKRTTSTMTNLTANDLPYFVQPKFWGAKDSSKGGTQQAILYNGTEALCGCILAAENTLTYCSNNAEGVGGNNVKINVPGGTGWTLAQVDACEVGVKQPGGASNGRVRVSAYWMDVAVNANEANWAPFPVAASTARSWGMIL